MVTFAVWATAMLILFAVGLAGILWATRDRSQIARRLRDAAARSAWRDLADATTDDPARAAAADRFGVAPDEIDWCDGDWRLNSKGAARRATDVANGIASAPSLKQILADHHLVACRVCGQVNLAQGSECRQCHSRFEPELPSIQPPSRPGRLGIPCPTRMAGGCTGGA